MTPEQKERIKKAAREMEAALNEVRTYFDISIDATNAAQFGSPGPQYIYQVRVTQINQEVIA